MNRELLLYCLSEIIKVMGLIQHHIYFGNADYVSHEGEKLASFVWKLHAPIPTELLSKADKSIAIYY